MNLIKTIIIALSISSHLYSTDTLTLDQLPEDVLNEVYSYISFDDLHNLKQTSLRVQVQTQRHRASVHFRNAPLSILPEPMVKPETGYENIFGLAREPRLVKFNIKFSNSVRGFSQVFDAQIDGQSYSLSFLEIRPITLTWLPLPINLEVTRVYRAYGYIDENGKTLGYTRTESKYFDQANLSGIDALRLWGSGMIETLRAPSLFTHPIRLSFCDAEAYVSTPINERLGISTLPSRVFVRLTMPHLNWSATLCFIYSLNERLVPVTLDDHPITLDQNGDFHMAFPDQRKINILIIDEKNRESKTYKELQKSAYEAPLNLSDIGAIRFSHDHGLSCKSIAEA